MHISTRTSNNKENTKLTVVLQPVYAGDLKDSFCSSFQLDDGEWKRVEMASQITVDRSK